jgi:hypothetical protein
MGLLYAESSDDGSTFGLGGLLGGPASAVALVTPQFVADPAGGLNLSYYNVMVDSTAYLVGRASDPSALGDPYTFLTPKAKTLATMANDLTETAPTRLGDYTGLAATATTLFASYVDNNYGASRIRVHVAPLF